ncbi:tafazzin homolog isoform X2 [Anopheles merus]|uniref:tafazzin homolog isoform X2 n=1 Tax=Anopheles merus TaxID=30066 RepID=UPI001BE4DDA0|nr:tafazzin homolog isoform X2 [Anopheles merus]
MVGTVCFCRAVEQHHHPTTSIECVYQMHATLHQPKPTPEWFALKLNQTGRRQHFLVRSDPSRRTKTESVCTRTKEIAFAKALGHTRCIVAVVAGGETKRATNSAKWSKDIAAGEAATHAIPHRDPRSRSTPRPLGCVVQRGHLCTCFFIPFFITTRSSSSSSSWSWLLLRSNAVWYLAAAASPRSIWLNKARVHNIDVLENALENRPKGKSLLTVSNHHSCFDDPGIWGLLKLRNVCNKNVIRWSMAAHDICFTCKAHSLFFMYGKCIPVVRGGGVYQPAVDLCIEKLKLGDWVHVFPEGKVNMTKEDLRFKWGVGRIIYEAPDLPIIIPIWHIGMDDVLPNEPPYYLRMGKKLTYNFGNPIDLSALMERLRSSPVSEEEARKQITDRIQEEMMILKQETERLHSEYVKS